MISIIVPTFNEEKIIAETLKKLQALRGKGFEIVLSDAKSQDRTVQQAAPFADRVVVEPNPERRTIGRGRNLGAAAAQGDFLVFIDADVEIPKPAEFFKKALARFDTDPSLVGLTVSLRVSPQVATWADNLIFSGVNLVHRFNNNLRGSGSASGEFQMVRANAFRRLGGYRENLAVSEDNEFFLRLSKIGRTQMAPDLYVFHSGRRAHRVGWLRLLLSWLLNAVSVKLLGRSADKEWKVVR